MTDEAGDHLSFPFRIGRDGRTARVPNPADHIREEIIQLVLTNPGERLVLPEFGGGIRRLVFENSDDVMVGMTRALLTRAISRYLGHRVTLEALDVVVENETVEVSIGYRMAGTEESRVLTFQRTGS